MPWTNLWDEFMRESPAAQNGQALSCLGCSLTMDGLSNFLEVPSVHDGILKFASVACILSGAVGGRFEVCPQIVRLFGEPMFDVIGDYLLTKNRICNENLGWCTSPVITKIDVE